MNMIRFACALLLSAGILSTGAIASDQRPDSTKAASAAETVPSPNEFVAVDELPELLKQTPPKYPEAARSAGLEGKVALKILVNTTGKVDSIYVMNPKPEMAEFENSALTAAKLWEFKPATVNGKPTRIWVAQIVRFKLNAGKK